MKTSIYNAGVLQFGREKHIKPYSGAKFQVRQFKNALGIDPFLSGKFWVRLESWGILRLQSDHMLWGLFFKKRTLQRPIYLV